MSKFERLSGKEVVLIIAIVALLAAVGLGGMAATHTVNLTNKCHEAGGLLMLSANGNKYECIKKEAIVPEVVD